MIDATKLADGGLYHVQYHYGVWTAGRWNASKERFTVIGSTITYSLIELTAAIPIPTPEQLAEMWEVIGKVANAHNEKIGPLCPGGIVSGITITTARKLLEQRT